MFKTIALSALVASFVALAGCSAEGIGEELTTGQSDLKGGGKGEGKEEGKGGGEADGKKPTGDAEDCDENGKPTKPEGKPGKEPTKPEGKPDGTKPTPTKPAPEKFDPAACHKACAAKTDDPAVCACACDDKCEEKPSEEYPSKK